MECQNCELKQRQFYCDNCLRQHLLSLRLQTQHAAADRDAHIASAEKALNSVINPARLRRAETKGREERVQEIWDGLNQLRQSNEQLRERVQKLRNSLATRRRTLAIANSTFSSDSSSVSSTPSSPPHAAQSTSPQAGRPFQRRESSSVSSQSSTPTPPSVSPAPRPLTSTARPLSSNFFTPTSPQASRSPLSVATTPPQNHLRPSLLSGPSYATVQGRTVSAGSAPYGTPIPTRGVDPIVKQIEDLQAYMVVLSERIARARSGLVHELVEVFSVVEVGGRPPLGGKAGTKGEWTIGGLVLPVPGDIRRYPPDHINAVLTHTIHFVTLLAFYLGIKLPFEVVWSRSSTPPSGSTKGSGLLGVGIPWIGAIRGGESGGWARWSTKQPLHVSSAPPPPSSSNISSPSSSRPLSYRSHTTPTPAVGPIQPQPSSSPPSPSSPATHHRSNSLTASTLADSHYFSAPASSSSSSSSSSPGNAFTTALAMLLYDVCYLAHTQSVDVPLAHAGDVLGNLWAVCCSPDLGRRAHATTTMTTTVTAVASTTTGGTRSAPTNLTILTTLPPPTPAAFQMDFSQLLQATAATPARVRARGTSGKEKGRVVRSERIVEEDEDGWDLLDTDFTE